MSLGREVPQFLMLRLELQSAREELCLGRFLAEHGYLHGAPQTPTRPFMPFFAILIFARVHVSSLLISENSQFVIENIFLSAPRR